MISEVNLFKALADPTRLRLLALLCETGEAYVGSLAAALKVPEYAVSRHLRILREAGLVRATREGTWMRYELAEPRTALAKRMFECFRQCLRHHPMAKEDVQRHGRAAGANAGRAGNGREVVDIQRGR